MLNNDNRNRILGASLVFAGIVGLIAPPIPSGRVCAAELLRKAGVRISYVAPSARAPRAPQVRVIKAHSVRLPLPTL